MEVIMKKVWIMLLMIMVLAVGCGKQKAENTDAGNTSTEQMTESSAGNVVEPEENTVPEDLSYVAKLHVTINPDLALYLDADQNVVFVEYLNDDAKNAYADIDMQGVRFDAALKVIVETAVDEGYLIEGKTVSVDVAECDETVSVAEITAQIETSVQEAATQKEVGATLAISVAGEPEREVAVQPKDIGDGQNPDNNGDTAQEAGEEKPENGGGETTAGGNGTTGDGGAAEENDTTGDGGSAGNQDAEPCSACGGTGICAECGGGTLPCKRCGGTLVETCGNCDASGKQKCPGCKGSGTDATDGSTCKYCGGSGKITCELCGGTHGKPCTICKGKGVISDDCILCHGDKKCTVCGGTGYKK